MSRLISIFQCAFSYLALHFVSIQLKSLVEKCDEKDIEIRNIHVELERNNEKVHVLQTTLGKSAHILTSDFFSPSLAQSERSGSVFVRRQALSVAPCLSQQFALDDNSLVLYH